MDMQLDNYPNTKGHFYNIGTESI